MTWIVPLLGFSCMILLAITLAAALSSWSLPPTCPKLVLGLGLSSIALLCALGRLRHAAHSLYKHVAHTEGMFRALSGAWMVQGSRKKTTGSVTYLPGSLEPKLVALAPIGSKTLHVDATGFFKPMQMVGFSPGIRWALSSRSPFSNHSGANSEPKWSNTNTTDRPLALKKTQDRRMGWFSAVGAGLGWV